MNAANRKSRVLPVTLLVLSGSVPAAFLSAAEPPLAPASQPNSQVVSVHLRAVLTRANQAVNSKNYDLALKELDAADAMQPKTPFDQSIIDRLRAFAKAQSTKTPQ